MMLFFQDPIISSGAVNSLIDKYGLTGVAFVICIYMIWQLSKRIAELENKRDTLLADYVKLVERNIAVIEKVTGCIDSIKERWDRIERRLDHDEPK